MKRILFTLISMIAFFSTANAQSMKVYQNGQLKAIYYVSKDDKIEFSDDFPFPEEEGMENGHQYVDLGLSVKWATTNVGSSTPEGYGDYYAWGETVPYYFVGHSQDNPCLVWNSGKTAGYDWASYKWCNGSALTITKYSNTVDDKTILDPEDDAAYVNWGGNWRMPTNTELEELYDNCTWTWTTQNGVEGYKITSKKNENFIFLPAAGYREYSGIFDVGSYGGFWSSSLYVDGGNNPYHLGIRLGTTSWGSQFRYKGLSVRPVCP